MHETASGEGGGRFLKANHCWDTTENPLYRAGTRRRFCTLKEMEVALGLVGVPAYLFNCPLTTMVVKHGCCTLGKQMTMCKCDLNDCVKEKKEHVKKNENSFSLLRASLLDQGSLKISVFATEQAHMAVASRMSMLLKFLSVFTNVGVCDKGR